MIVSIADVWDDAKLAHHRFHTRVLTRAISVLSRNGASACEVKLGSFIEENYLKIVMSRGEEMVSIISDFELRFSEDEEKTVALGLAEKLISYKDFSIKKDWQERQWCAYKLCLRARYPICPYCHLAPVDSNANEHSDDGEYRTALDHFYCKSRYPYLALTLFNLVPVCDRCNGFNFKHDADFAAFAHLNPLADIESLRFELTKAPAVLGEPVGTWALTENSGKYILEIVHDGDNLDKAERSLVTFGLRSRYEVAKDEAFRLRRQLRTMFSRQRMAAEVLPGLDIELADTVGFDLKDDQYKKVLLGKMKFDIFRTLQEEFPPLQ